MGMRTDFDGMTHCLPKSNCTSEFLTEAVYRLKVDKLDQLEVKALTLSFKCGKSSNRLTGPCRY